MTDTTTRVQELARVLEVGGLGAGLHHMVLESPRIASVARAGNFVLTSVRPGVEPPVDPLLPRPFSLLSSRPRSGEIELYFRASGRGTALMSSLEAGAALNVIGPLGGAWPMPEGDRILVAGGVGMPPLLYLAEELALLAPSSRAKAQGATLFYGARSADELHMVDRFEAAGVKVHLCTDDGSAGEQGTCVEALERYLLPSSEISATIFGCGPGPMLERLPELAGRVGMPAFVSLESPMACGIGVCRGCAVEMRDGTYRMACTDGPIFPAEEVAFR